VSKKPTKRPGTTPGQKLDKASLERSIGIDRTMAVLPVLIPAAAKQLADGFVFSDIDAPGIPVVWVTTPEGLFEDLKKNVAAGEWARIVNVVQLRAALNNGDDFKAQDARAKLLGLPPEWQSLLVAAMPKAQRDLISNVKNYAPHIVAGEFSRQMSSTRMVLWLNTHTDRLEPGILCPDLKGAFFVRVALGKTVVCPCCDKPFKPDRPDQEYCTIQCRERFRKRRQRARQLKRRKK
jgi:hypothetical protein